MKKHSLFIAIYFACFVMFGLAMRTKVFVPKATANPFGPIECVKTEPDPTGCAIGCSAPVVRITESYGPNNVETSATMTCRDSQEDPCGPDIIGIQITFTNACCPIQGQTNPHFVCNSETLKCQQVNSCGSSTYGCVENDTDCPECPAGTYKPHLVCVSGVCQLSNTCGVNACEQESYPCGSCVLDTDCDWCWPACVCFEGTCSFTPIVIDVSGNGFDLTDATNGVDFDFVGDGSLIRSAWTARDSDDAWLALDRNGNGTIDSALELFGGGTAQPLPQPGEKKNGFLALAEFDRITTGGNEDGQIDARDSIFTSLRLWQDLNHNGVSEVQELRTLQNVGLATIDLDYKESRRRDQHGNQFKYRAKVKDVGGEQLGRWAWDVILRRR